MSQEALIPGPAPAEDIDSLKKENEILRTSLSILGEKLRLAETQSALNQAQLMLSEQQG